MRLSDLKTGEEGIIVKIHASGSFSERITEMGVVRGQRIRVIRNDLPRNSIEYTLMGYEITLRREEAQHIEVSNISFSNPEIIKIPDELKNHTRRNSNSPPAGKEILVAILGNPNAGQTSFFNKAGRSREKRANYRDMTVGSKVTTFTHHGYSIRMVDLPGTCSMSSCSPEEVFIGNFIQQMDPDVLVNIVDGANLERDLYLTTRLIDLERPCIIALNMYDEMLRKGIVLDYNSLGEMLGIPVIPISSTRGKGKTTVLDKVVQLYEGRDGEQRQAKINYGPELETSILLLQDKLHQIVPPAPGLSTRYMALRLLGRDYTMLAQFSGSREKEEIIDLCENEIRRVEKLHYGDTEALIADARNGFIAGALTETLQTRLPGEKDITRKIDRVVSHKYLAYPLFFTFMFVMFLSTFELGKYPVALIESLVAVFSGFLGQLVPAGSLKDLLIDGIISGMGSVIIFLPNILILFLFISLMEDTGYMARVAFIMDRLMHRIGLHGKSFIPLIMGFGCNVPAIMATRTIENRKNRILTILIAPLMSCSARLPVYILFISCFFHRYQGAILFLIYLTGILLAVMVGLLLKKILFRGDEAPFVMELPPYRVPTLRSLVKHMWHNAGQYLKKMGGVILVASIIIWALGYFPRNVSYSRDFLSEMEEISKEYQPKAELAEAETGKFLLMEKTNRLNTIREEMLIEKQSKTYIGQIGRFLEPVLLPLGFDWRMGVSLITGIAAKEVVISTLGVLFVSNTEQENGSANLKTSLVNARHTQGLKKGQPLFTPVTAVSFMIFILVYFPCVAVIAAVRKEAGGWKWAWFVAGYTTLFAWILSFLVNKTGTWLFF